MPSSHLMFCCPLLLLPPIPPSIRVFSNESTLCMSWAKYWSFSFSISPSNEHPGLISFRMDWLNFLNLTQMTIISTTMSKNPEKVMAPHSSTLAWKIPWTEKPGRLLSMGSLRVRHDWLTSLSLFTFLHWRRKWQPTPLFLPGESQGWQSLVGWCLWGHIRLDMFEVTKQQQHGQESLRRSGVATIVDKRVRNAVRGCNLWNNRMIALPFQGKPLNITVIQVYTPISNAEEAELYGSKKTYKTF